MPDHALAAKGGGGGRGTGTGRSCSRMRSTWSTARSSAWTPTAVSSRASRSMTVRIRVLRLV